LDERFSIDEKVNNNNNNQKEVSKAIDVYSDGFLKINIVGKSCFCEETYFTGSWWGFNVNMQLHKICHILFGDCSMLRINQSDCSHTEYLKCMSYVDQIALLTRSKQGLISHIIFAKRFKGLVGKCKIKDELLEMTYPLEIYGGNNTKRLTALLFNTGNQSLFNNIVFGSNWDLKSNKEINELERTIKLLDF